MTPLVSAIITTADRPHLVGRAIRSALEQTVTDLEVIVVVDGPDPATERVLAAIDDRRVHLEVRPRRGGQGEALNTGIRRAGGEWIALLDDDDLWLPTKIERQLEAGASSSWPLPIVAARFIARGEGGDVVWPSRRPALGEPICEYLFCRHRLRFGEGVLPTSVLCAPSALWRAVAPSENLSRHCDLDWLVRAGHRSDVGLELPADERPLAVWDMRRGRARMSNAHDWRASLAWIDGRRDWVSARAYAGFLLTWVSHSARCEGDVRAFVSLVRAALRSGRTSPLELLIHAAIWAVPPALRARVGNPARWPTSEAVA